MLQIIIILLLLGIIIALGVVYYMRSKGTIYERAIQTAMRGDYTDARGMIRSRIEIDPNNFQAQYVMSEIYKMEGNDFGELQHLLELQKIGKYPPGVSPVRIANRVGEIHYNQENYTESFEAYYEGYLLNSKNEEALAHLAFLAIGKGEFEIAERFYKILVEISPSVPDYRLARAVGLSMLGSKLALDEFETVLLKKKSDLTANFLTAFQAFKQGKHKRCLELIDGIVDRIEEKSIKYLTYKLGCAASFGEKDYERALNYAKSALLLAVEENLDREINDAKLSLSYMAILSGQLDLANEHLLELEIKNPHDDLIIKVSDFRMDLEENVTTVDQVSPRGFDFSMHLLDWMKKRFPDNMAYRISGLKMDADFQINLISGDQVQRPRISKTDIDYDTLIDQFNNLKDAAFENACEKIVRMLGYNVQKSLDVRERDGRDFIAQDLVDKKRLALFRLRKWKNQPISDIFLRDLQNYMNELKVSNGYVIAGARLTAGAEQALQNLKKIEVINEERLGEILAQIFGVE